MPSKLVRFFIRSVFLSFTISLLGVSGLAAVVTTPESPYSRDTTDNIYYAYDDPNFLVDTDADFSKFELTGTTYSSSGMVILDVSTDLAETTNLVLALQIRDSSDTEDYYNVPIAAAESDTIETPAECDSLSCPAANSGYYVSANLSAGSTLRIGFFPAAACVHAAGNLGKTLTGCSGSAVDEPTTVGSVVEFKMRVVVANLTISTDEIADDINGNPTEDDRETDTFSVFFQNGQPEMSCEQLTDFYFPGDRRILVNLDGIITSTSVSSGAAVGAILLFAKQYNNRSTPSYATYGNHTFRSVLQLSSEEQTVSGFENTTTGNDRFYSLSMAARNTAGILSEVNTHGVTSEANHKRETSCSFEAVQTSAIFGVLSESRCFIATASFGSSEGPVRVLRNFRDQILTKNSIGRAFTDWYYSWSPQAALWILERPLMKQFVLVALIPIQIVAIWALGFEYFLFLGLLLFCGVKWFRRYS